MLLGTAYLGIWLAPGRLGGLSLGLGPILGVLLDLLSIHGTACVHIGSVVSLPGLVDCICSGVAEMDLELHQAGKACQWPLTHWVLYL